MTVLNPTQYSISQLAKEFDITNRSLRHYEEFGLITPQRVGKRRVYNKKDRTRLQLILRGKRVGFSLTEIKEIIDLYQDPQGKEKQEKLLLNKISEQRLLLKQQLKDIKIMLQELDKLEDAVKNTHSK